MVTQHDNNMIEGQHSFYVHNLETPVYICFKRLAMDSNDCYLNNSWHITVILENLTEIAVTNDRSPKIEINPYKEHYFWIRATYDTESIRPGEYKIMVQMNLIAEDIDEPHYFFETISYQWISEQGKGYDFIPIYLLFAITMIVIYFIAKKYQRDRKKKVGD